MPLAVENVESGVGFRGLGLMPMMEPETKLPPPVLTVAAISMS